MDNPKTNRSTIRKITSDDDKMLFDYGNIHIKMAQRCSNSKGLYKSQNMAFFNDSYRTGKDIRISRSIFTYPVNAEDQSSHPEFGYLNRVLELCSRSDICSKLGLNIADFMNMDLNTFVYIEEFYNRLKAKEGNDTKDILKDNGIDLSKL